MAKPTVLISGLALVAVAVIGGLMYGLFSLKAIQLPIGKVPIPAPNEDIQDKNTIAYQWRWENFTDSKPVAVNTTGAKNETKKIDEGRPTGEVPYDVVVIYDVLQTIHLDADGRVVPDQTAKEALEQGFAEFGADLSPDALAELQELIRTGLPGEAGEEAARIMESYFQFRLAEEELNVYVPREGEAPTIDRYETVVKLRRSYLGDDIADKLFEVEDAQARFTFATIAIAMNADLTDEEKQAQQLILREKLDDRLLALGQLEPEEAAAEKVRRLRANGASSEEIFATREGILGTEKAQALAAIDREDIQWQDRFDRFWQARQQVIRAGLDKAETERQIDQLMNQFFSPAERERARDNSFTRQARDQSPVE